VQKWQQQTQYLARRNGWVNTMMGRYRKLGAATQLSGPAQGHAMRAAINTPIQVLYRWCGLLH
jgi:DNA polymerase I-like protein with 3'-5' exonuclease and polymerase domains